MTKTIKLIAAATLFLGATELFDFAASAAAAKKPDPAETSVAARALKIVSGIHGIWRQMPGNIATSRMTGGALLGNGSVGVAVGGTPDEQEFYIGRNDFWSILRGSIMPVGRLHLSVARCMVPPPSSAKTSAPPISQATSPREIASF